MQLLNPAARASSVWSESAYYTDAPEGNLNQWDRMPDARRSTSTLSSGSHFTSATNPILRPEIIPLADRKINFLSEDGKRSWTEHVSLFIDESAAWSTMIDYETTHARQALEEGDLTILLPGLSREGPPGDLRFRLTGITPWDFDSLLSGLKPKLGKEIPYEQLCPMLVLSTDWGFNDLRNYCIQEITTKHAEDLPIPRILLARRANVAQWLFDSYVTLAERLAPLTPHESQLLGLEAAKSINTAREQIAQRREYPLLGPKPTALLGRWTLWHPYCYVILTDAWRKVLTQDRYDTLTPPQAMIRALKDIRGDQVARGRNLCRNCNTQNKIVEWLDLGMDAALARSHFEVCLEIIEPWIIS